MSASYVRNLVRKWCNEISVATSVPFYDTINRHQDPADPVWFTVQFESELTEGTFCSPNFIETGQVIVVFVAYPGTGDAACITALEQIIPLLFGKSDVKLALQSYEPVIEETLGTADKDYRMSVALNYRLSL